MITAHKLGIVGLVLLCSFRSSVATPVVTVTLVDNWYDHTWQLYGQATTDDNAGISAFAIDILDVNARTIEAPMGAIADPENAAQTLMAGFTIRLPSNVMRHGRAAGHAYAMNIFAAQDVLMSASLIYGVGQAPGVIDGPDMDVPYALPVLLASGVYSGLAPIFTPDPDYIAVNVFKTVGAVDCAPAQVQAIVVTQLQAIPEPSVVLLLALGTIQLRRRR